MTPNKAPILFLIFNRLTTTEKVFSAIRQSQPTRLYIASDGPRPQIPGEDKKVEAVRNYVIKHIDWDCQVNTLFRDKNLGCRLAVSTAIDWFFEQELEGVILEDDCVPNQSFFSYANELLDRYRYDERIMVISGNHFHGDAYRPEHSYFFSRYNHCWGWASWARAWQHYDRDMSLWPRLRDSDWLLTIGDGCQNFQYYWTQAFNMVYKEKIDTWDYQWTFSCWAQSGMSILPACNLVTNIGFGKDATHTQNGTDKFSSLPLRELKMPLSHPIAVIRDYAADFWSDKNIFRVRNNPKRIPQLAGKILMRTLDVFTLPHKHL